MADAECLHVLRECFVVVDRAQVSMTPVPDVGLEYAGDVFPQVFRCRPAVGADARVMGEQDHFPAAFLQRVQLPEKPVLGVGTAAQSAFHVQAGGVVVGGIDAGEYPVAECEHEIAAAFLGAEKRIGQGDAIIAPGSAVHLMVGIEGEAVALPGERGVLFQHSDEIVRLFSYRGAVGISARVVGVTQVNEVVRWWVKLCQRVHHRIGGTVGIGQAAEPVAAGAPVADDRDPDLAVAARLQVDRLFPVMLHEICDAVTFAHPFGQMVHRIILERPGPAQIQLLIGPGAVDVPPVVALYGLLCRQRGGESREAGRREGRRRSDGRHGIPDRPQRGQGIDLCAQCRRRVVQVVEQEGQLAVSIPGSGALPGHQSLYVRAGAVVLAFQQFESAANPERQVGNGKGSVRACGSQRIHMRGESFGQDGKQSCVVFGLSNHATLLSVWFEL